MGITTSYDYLGKNLRSFQNDLCKTNIIDALENQNGIKLFQALCLSRCVEFFEERKPDYQRGVGV